MTGVVYSKDRELLTRQIAGETLIVPIRGRVSDLDAIFTLNEVGVRVWQLLDGKIDVNQIVDIVAAEYDAPLETVRQDVTELLGNMAEAGLIRPV